MGTLQNLVIVLVIVGIVFGIGLLLLQEFGNQMGDTSTAVANESVVPTDAGTYLANNYTTTGVYCFNTLGVSRVENASGGELITVGNYTVNSLQGYITNTTDYYLGGDWNVTYTYLSGGGNCEGIDLTEEGLQGIPDWFTIIVIVVIAGLVLGIVFKIATKQPIEGAIAEI